MNRISLALLAAASLTLAGVGTGSAADLAVPLKAPPPAPTGWTGFYIGANGGAGTGTTETTANIGAALAGVIPGLGLSLPLPSQSFSGFLGGVTAGYNWQTGRFVLGIEGDFDGSTFQGNTACVLVLNCNVKHDWVGDITARLGVVAFDDALIYVKGGAAWADSRFNIGNTFTYAATAYGVNASANDTAVGGLFGTGIEYGFLPHWSAKIEYDYIQFADQNLNFPLTVTAGGVGVGVATVPATIKESVQFVKAGVNYHF